MAEQVLAAGLWYHAIFVRPLQAQMQETIDMIMGYVAGGRTVAGRARALIPSRQVSCRPAAAGGMGLVDVRAMVQAVVALQAKLVARLLEPEAPPWMTLFRQWLHRPQAFLNAHPAVEPRLAGRLVCVVPPPCARAEHTAEVASAIQQDRHPNQPPSWLPPAQAATSGAEPPTGPGPAFAPSSNHPPKSWA